MNFFFFYKGKFKLMLVSNLLLSRVEYLPWSALRIMLQVDDISPDGVNKTSSDKVDIQVEIL